MTALILKGRPAADEIKSQIRTIAEKLAEKDITAGLAVINASADPASAEYAERKIKLAELLGIRAELYNLSADKLKDEVYFLDLIKRLNADPKVHSVFIERPLPEALSRCGWLSKLSPEKDSEGEHPANIGCLINKETHPDFFSRPATAAACIKMLKHYGIPIAGKHAVIVGRSATVGKPLSMMLLEEDASVSICHSKTRNLSAFTLNADIIISAAGRKNLITADMVKPNSVILDVGLTYDADGTVHGDTDYENLIEKVQAITPARGGIGPVTTALLLYNVIMTAQKNA